MLDMIVCVDQNWNIGKDNNLLFKFSQDQKLFKQITMDNIVIMGRKTFESLKNSPIGLYGRENIVISRAYKKYDNYDFEPKKEMFKDEIPTRLYHVSSIEDAMNAVLEIQKNYPMKSAFVIGGGEIYTQFLEKNLIRRVILTTVCTVAKEADTKIPDLYAMGFKNDHSNPLWFNTGFEDPTPIIRNASNPTVFTCRVLTKS